MIDIDILFTLNIKYIPIRGTIVQKKEYLQNIYSLLCNRLLHFCKLTDQNHLDINVYSIKKYIQSDDLLDNLTCLILDYSDCDNVINLIEIYDSDYDNITVTDNNYDDMILNYLDLDNKIMLNIPIDADNRDFYLKNIANRFNAYSSDFLSL